MALIYCPECGKQISDMAPSCPYCGYVMQKTTAPDVVQQVEIHARSTDVGNFCQNITGGIIAIVVGIGLTIVGIITTIVTFLLGLPTLLVGMMIIGYGYMLCVGRAACECPYCGSTGKITKGDRNYKCPICKKISAYVDGKLKAT